MRSLLGVVIGMAAAAGLSACSTFGAKTAEPAAQPGTVHTVNTQPAVPGGAAPAQSAADEAPKPATAEASADAARDREIDEIVNQITTGPSGGAKGAPERATPAARVPARKDHPRAPAVEAAGITGSTGNAALPPLPQSVLAPAPVQEDAETAAARERLFPRPRWRRELAEKGLESAPVEAPAN